MSQENVEVVRRGFRAYNDRDFDGVVANFADDIEWRLIGGFANLVGAEFRGPEAVRGFLRELEENLGASSELESVRQMGEQVVAIVRSVGVGGASGAPATMRWGQVYTFREGKISAVDNYYEVEEALEAVGLRA
jgi:ketosteroid isomerase-like protein